MKKLKAQFISFLFLPSFVFAQTSGQGGTFSSDQNYINPSNGMANLGGTNVPTDKNLYEGVKGSPMIFKEFVKGSITIKDSVISMEQLTYNFDAFKHELHIRYPDSKVKIPFNNQINGFQLLDKGVIHNFKKRKLLPQSDILFYEIIAETPQYSLLKLWVRSFVRANPVEHGVYQSGQKYDEFQESEKFFFKLGGGTYTEFKKLTKSEFISLMPNLKKSIETYWSENKWGKKISDEDAIQLLKKVKQ